MLLYLHPVEIFNEQEGQHVSVRGGGGGRMCVRMCVRM